MVTPEVYPQDAAAAGCSASYSVMDSGSNSYPGLFSQTWAYYQLSATAAQGWTFHHFEWTQKKTYGSSSQSQDYTVYDNPYPNRKNSNLYEQNSVWVSPYESNNPDKYEITYCRAVFTQDTPTYGDITVTTAPDPVAGGTTTPTTETHQYAGSPSTTFTLTATPKTGYRFLNWKLNGTVVATTNTTIVTHAFTSSAQTFHYVAEFLQSSGLILHGSGGTILHGSGGSILHSG